MKNFTLKSFLFAFVAIAFITTFSACKKKKDDPTSEDPTAGYPKTVKITYRVSVAKGGINGASRITYTNESGGEDNLGLTTILPPWEKTITKTVKFGESVKLFADNSNPGQLNKGLTLEILIDGKSVGTTTTNAAPTDATVSAGAIYAFGTNIFVGS